VDRSWKNAGEFVAEIQRQLNDLASVKPYYYGTQDRLDAVKKNCSSAKVFSKSNMVFVPDVDAEGGGGDYILSTEMFASAFGIKYVDSNNSVLDFLTKSAALVNEKCFGSLSCTVVIDPRTRGIIGSKFDEFLYAVNWGTIGINVWAAFMAINPYGVWGAPEKRHDDTNIQSGSGKTGNCLLFKNVNKGLMEAKWCDPTITALLQAPTRGSATRAKAYTDFALRQSVGALLMLVKALFTAK